MDDRVRAYVCDAVGDCAADRITAVRRFEAGERHAVYQVSYRDPGGEARDVVARISLDASDREGAEREATVLRTVGGVAAPRLHDFRCQSPWFDAPSMCMAFVPGRQQEMAAASPDDIEHLGTVVGDVHRLPVDDLVEWFPATSPATYLDERWEVVVRKLPAVRDPLPASVQRRLVGARRSVEVRLAAARREGTDHDDGLALLHGDVAAGNIIWGDTPVLIDWEYARLGDPADEVAYAFGQNGLTAAQREAFWRGYRRSAPERRLERVADRVGWWEPMNLLGSVLWWIERWSDRADADATGGVAPSAPKSQTYYLDQAVRRLDRLERLLQPQQPD